MIQHSAAEICEPATCDMNLLMGLFRVLRQVAYKEHDLEQEAAATAAAAEPAAT
jgi:hypothetical protein